MKTCFNPLAKLAVLAAVASLTANCLGWDNKAHRAAAKIALDRCDPHVELVIREIFVNGGFIQGYEAAVENPPPNTLEPTSAQINDPFHYSAFNKDNYQYVNNTIQINPDSLVGPNGEPAMPRFLRQTLEALRRPGSLTKAQRALGLLRLMRIIPELAHPIHCAQLQNPVYPNGDNHGYNIWVKYHKPTPFGLAEGYDTRSLRWFWNSMLDSRIGADLTGYDPDEALSSFVEEVEGLPGKPDEPSFDINNSEQTFAAWAMQTANVTADLLYAPLAGDLSKQRHRDDPILLQDDYVYHCLTIAEQRMLTAGYWLAAVLKSLFACTRESDWLS